MMLAIYEFMRELPFFKEATFTVKNSETIQIVMNGNTRTMWCYPGKVGVRFLPFSSIGFRVSFFLAFDLRGTFRLLVASLKPPELLRRCARGMYSLARRDFRTKLNACIFGSPFALNYMCACFNRRGLY
jgi:hypothetical protein